MKKLSFIIAIFFYWSFSCGLVLAQSTEIKPGSILPQMITAQRTALVAVNGMLVFDTDTQSNWSYQSGAWVNLAAGGGGGTSYWSLNGTGGNEIKNTNAGGFWSQNPSIVDYNIAESNYPPTAPVNGPGTRLMWIPSRSAFRVGTVIGDEWDASNIGLFSFASGFSSKASGKYSTAMGYSSLANGRYSSAFGYVTQASGYYSTAMGSFSLASGYYSTAMGFNSVASGIGSTAIGEFLDVGANGGTALGRFNINNPNGLFMVGNGNFTDSRFNAFIIRRDNNRIGIGIDNPLAALHVAGGDVYSLGSIYYKMSPTGLDQNNGFNGNLGIISENGILSKTFVAAAQTITASDTRIKNIISLTNNSEDLERLRKIQITNYRMKDVATWGDKTFKKVIAQQVEEVYPEVIKHQISVIPDIYTLAESVVYDAATKNLSVTLSKEYNIKIGEKIELVHPEKDKILAEVITVNGNTFTVKDWNYATDKIFVFGREVNDFRSVDYEGLSMLGISAIQQLAKENEELRIKNYELWASGENLRFTIEELRLKNNNLEVKHEKTEARLEAIENLLKANVPTGK
jgi:Head domain of trimeric autotransporter adhesin/Chaperone of endosialidase